MEKIYGQIDLETIEKLADIIRVHEEGFLRKLFQGKAAVRKVVTHIGFNHPDEITGG